MKKEKAHFKKDPARLIKFTGTMFMLVTTILFYESLYVAAGNPGFFVVVYFNYFGEGMLELVVFTALIPFIVYTIWKEVKSVMYWS